MEYKNKGLKQIAEKFSINFHDIDDKFPTNLETICESLDICPEFAELRDGMSGYFDAHQKKIFVNKFHSAKRICFTIAHELGHYTLGHGSSPRDEYKNYNKEQLANEYAANNFAAELLMPNEAFTQFFQENIKTKSEQSTFIEISKYFCVSEQAAKVRAFNLGLIDSL